MERCSSSSSVASDDSDGDAGLLASLLGPSSIGSVSRASMSSDFSFYRAVDSPPGLPQAGPHNPVARWRLAREGPFLSELPHSGIGGFGRGCAFRNITFAQPPEKYGLLLHHPWFLEWIGAPESARLLDIGPSTCQLHRDMCLLTSNLNILLFLNMLKFTTCIIRTPMRQNAHNHRSATVT